MEVNGYRILYVDSDEKTYSLLERIKRVPRNSCLVVHDCSPIFFEKREIEKLKDLEEELQVTFALITGRDEFIRNILRAGLKVYRSFQDFRMGNFVQPPAKANRKADEVREDFEQTIEFTSVEEDNEDEFYNNHEEEKKKEDQMKWLFLYGRDPKKSRRKRIFKWTGVAMLTIFLFVVMGYLLFFPLLIVEIVPRGEFVEEDFEFIAVLSGTETGEDLLPLHNFRLSLADEITVPVLGRKEVGVDRAVGSVLLINETDRPVKVPAGTRVMTEGGIQFRILADVTVPPVEVKEVMGIAVGMENGQARAEIQAVNPGKAGNVEPGAITSFTGEDFPLQIINPEPTYGGETRETAMVTPEDISRARDELIGKLKESIIRKVYQELGSDYRIFPDKIKYIPKEINCLQAVGTRETSLQAEGTLEARGIIVRHHDLNKFLRQAFLPKLQEGLVFSLENMNIKNLKLQEIEENKYKLTTRLITKVYRDLDPGQIARALCGKSLEEARRWLEKNKDIQSFEIVNNWNFDFMPPLSAGIEVVITGG